MPGHGESVPALGLDSAAIRPDRSRARALCSRQVDRLDDAQRRSFHAEATANRCGVPASEPGWVRLLDGTLSALALSVDDPRACDRWSEMLGQQLRLHRGHRPAWVWVPLGAAAGRPDDWEHAIAGALACAAGWVNADDWSALRARTLGVAARGIGHPSDQRLVAAGRLWSAHTQDTQAARLLARPTIGTDPLAAAIVAIADAIVRGERLTWTRGQSSNITHGIGMGAVDGVKECDEHNRDNDTVELHNDEHRRR